ncbi:MAG: glycosyltransferase family 39 protein [Acidobacteriia bacterium]|nr:glycosyltransferase family 39 protein [Terriglobia bacterium]
MLAITAALLPAFLGGLGLVLLLTEFPRKQLMPWVLLLLMTVGSGFGITSVVYFLWRLFSLSPRVLVLMDWAVAACVVAAAILKIRRSKLSATEPALENGINDAPSGLRRILSAVFFLMLTGTIVYLVSATLRHPQGEADAVPIWNLHARFLFRGGANWAAYLTRDLSWTHPDYPLLLPATVARVWTYLGRDPSLVSALIACLFLLSTVGLLVSGLALLKGREEGYLAGMLLLGTPLFVRIGGSQMADLPLSYFLLVPLVLICLYDQSAKPPRGLLILTGLFVGCAAWTKNEGLLFALAILIARFISKKIYSGWWPTIREIGFLLIGMSPCLLLVFYFRTRWAPANDLIGPLQLHMLTARASDITRYALILKEFLLETVRFSRGFVSLPLLAIYLILVRTRIPKSLRAGTLTAWLTYFLMLLGYFFIYIITPHDLAWNLEASLERLYVQLWPMVLFACFLAAKGPRELLQKA